MEVFFEFLKYALCVSCTLFMAGFGATGIVEAVIRYRDYLDYRKEKKKDATQENH